VALLLSLASAAGAALALALPETLPVGVAVALLDAVGDSGPNCALSSTTGAAANAASPACIATTSQRPPTTVGVSNSPATVHAAGVLLANDTGRKLELLQLRGSGVGGPQYGPPSGVQVMVCAAAPLANVMLAPPTVLQWPSSAARQVSAPNAPVNFVCQKCCKSALRIVGNEATPRPAGVELGVVSVTLTPCPTNPISPGTFVTTSAGASAERKPNPSPATSPSSGSLPGPWKPAVISAPPVATKRASAPACASMAAASTASRPKPSSGGGCLLASAMAISRGLISPHASALKKVVKLPPKARARLLSPVQLAYGLRHGEHNPVVLPRTS
jgi:hypothetical protein